jgi:hypothetical protein
MIEAILGYPCSKADRDRVWEEMQSDAPLTPDEMAGDDVGERVLG